jgi:ribonuclease HII
LDRFTTISRKIKRFNLIMHSLSEEKKLGSIIIGVDEVGRGPLAGPVTAAAVMFNAKSKINKIDDSKKLSPGQREELFNQIISNSKFAIGFATVGEIDKLNILQASLLAMKRSVESLKEKNATILIDGKFSFDSTNKNIKTFIKGDQLYPSIAAASIVAKVVRDRYMTILSKKYQNYGWEQNAGYGTSKHIQALKIHGITPFHRKSFAPVHNILLAK